MSLRVGVAGATGALGQEILKVLDQARWRPAEVVPLASATTSVSFAEYGSEQIAVDDLDMEAMEGLDALFLAVPPDVARRAGERAVAEGVPVIDCSGAFAADHDVPVVVPWVNPEALAELPLRQIVATPSPVGLLLASVLGPLRRAGIEGPVTATVLISASVWGRPGIEELSKQVVALFSSGTPPRKVFESGLAFDLLPWVGAAGPDGWTVTEKAVADEVSRLTGALAPMAITVVGAPLFTGVAAQIHVRTSRVVPVELALRVLQDGGVVVPRDEARSVPRPRKVEGKPFAHVGRVRPDPSGEGIHLWAAIDNLRAAATTAVSAAGVLLRVASRPDGGHGPRADNES